MTLFIFLQSILSLFPPLDFYNISFADVDGQEINMSDFRGKRILVVPMDAPSIDTIDFSYLDSVQNATPGLQIIVVPAINSLNGQTPQEVQVAKEHIHSTIILSALADITRNAEAYQHTLFQWLTKTENNQHFDIDGKPVQYFLVSGKGTLYAVLDQGSPLSSLEYVLQQQFDESNEYILNQETNTYEPKE